MIDEEFVNPEKLLLEIKKDLEKNNGTLEDFNQKTDAYLNFLRTFQQNIEKVTGDFKSTAIETASKVQKEMAHERSLLTSRSLYAVGAPLLMFLLMFLSFFAFFHYYLPTSADIDKLDAQIAIKKARLEDLPAFVHVTKCGDTSATCVKIMPNTCVYGDNRNYCLVDPR